MNTTIEIFINQVGYLPEQKKTAYIRGCKGGEAFSLCNKDGSLIYEGKLDSSKEDRLSGEQICMADFTQFNKPGNYYIQIQDTKSYVFQIKTDVYKDLYYSTLNYFYLSRCGQAIDVSKLNQQNIVWNRPACHTGSALIYGTNERKTVLGGWHDAGDYGRYVVAGAKTVMDLLLAYEYSKDKYTEFDILDEVKFELTWMLDMQREDGGVYHKISCYHFCAFIKPEDEKDDLVIAPVSTAATADFAACAAYASAFFKDSDADFACKLSEAALKSQNYLETHEDELYKNPSEITTGGYGDWNVVDERYFALCSLFVSTGKKEYLENAKEIRSKVKAVKVEPSEPWKRMWVQGFGWGSVAGYGTEILLKNKDKIEDKAFIAELEQEILERADSVMEQIAVSSFNLGVKFVQWGSNGHVCDEAHILLLAYDLTGNKKYYEGAVFQLHYILGCNPLNICYVTGNGTKSTVNPHHRPSGALKTVMPGMLAGGPSEGLQDQLAKEKLQGKAPLQCYLDETGSFSTNEIAIYWNSPLVYLIARLSF